MRPVWAQIDLAALRHNLSRVRQAAPASRIMAVVKANAYGHGLLDVARVLAEAGADGFGVASVEEALALRRAGLAVPITLLSGFFAPEELEPVSEQHLLPVVYHEHQIGILEQARLTRPIDVWLKIDSGMHRLGFPPERAGEVFARLRACAAVGRIGLMSHLARADDRSAPHTTLQLETFQAAIDGLEGERTLANSGGVLGWPATQLDWVRPGLMLYGISPFVTGTAGDEDLRPVMTLKSRLIAVNCFRRGDAIGYGGAWVCPEDMPVGVAAVGYGDGYPRHAPSGTPVLVKGERAVLVGRVSMDLLCIDLRSQPGARVGDPVTLWGEGLPVEEIAAKADTIAYQLVCGVTGRVRRVPASA